MASAQSQRDAAMFRVLDDITPRSRASIEPSSIEVSMAAERSVDRSLSAPASGATSP
jgi:hypothetical protein